jgi:hypothetical protein
MTTLVKAYMDQIEAYFNLDTINTYREDTTYIFEAKCCAPMSLDPYEQQEVYDKIVDLLTQLECIDRWIVVVYRNCISIRARHESQIIDREYELDDVLIQVCTRDVTSSSS